MPSADSAAFIVARFLKANHYNESYEAFVREAGLPEHAGTVSKGDLTLEVLLDEKRNFDLNQKFEKLGTGDDDTNWKHPSPSIGKTVTTLPSQSNLLSVAVENVALNQHAAKPVVLASTADRQLHVLNTPSCSLRESTLGVHVAPILSAAIVKERTLLTSSMSGHLQATDLEGRSLDERKDHNKYLIKVAVFDHQDELLVATAGWDNKVTIYRPSITDSFKFNDPIATISLPTKPESILFTRHPDNSKPILILTRTDSTVLHFYTIETTPRLLGKQNLAPHSNAWVAFTPSALSLSPKDPSLLAVGTSSVPHMKLLIVRLLTPPYDASQAPTTTSTRASLLDDTLVAETQASQARAALAVADREAAAILIHCTTMAPQTPYSTPAVAWRPDASGVWVNGDDGAVRGIEANTGKVVATLKDGHVPGSKIRCLWAGAVEVADEQREEWLITGGFDQRLIVWRVEQV